MVISLGLVNEEHAVAESARLAPATKRTRERETTAPP
jgi:hypothetical protein